MSSRTVKIDDMCVEAIKNIQKNATLLYEIHKDKFKPPSRGITFREASMILGLKEKMKMYGVFKIDELDKILRLNSNGHRGR